MWPLFLLLLGAGAFAASTPARPRRAQRSRGCDLTPALTARLEEDLVNDWADCPGRTESEMLELVRWLRVEGRSALAAAMLARINETRGA